MSEAEIIPPPSEADARDRASRNPFANEQTAIARVPIGAAANAEGQRSVAEVQARMMMARMNPRNPIQCMDAILQDCTRPTLAKEALYQYSRGGQAVSGPSIRLMESIARRWGNIASGIIELSRANGYSECKAYAWDLESGYYDDRVFQVRHWRDLKNNKGYVLTDERDIYELIANMGQRRKRSVLQAVIPGDVTEAAEEQCEKTLTTSVDTSPEALKRLAEAFAHYDVTQAQLEKRCQCRLEAIRPAQVVQLRKIYTSLKDGMSVAGDWFGERPSGPWQEIEERHAASAEAQQAQKPAPRPRTAPRATRAADPNPPESTQTPQQPAAPAAASPAPTATGPIAAAAPPPELTGTTIHASSGGVPWIETWLTDEDGNVYGEEPVKTAFAYANELEAMWRASARPDTLLEQNRDGMDDAAKSDPRAAEIIANLIVTDTEPTDYVVPMPMSRDGKPNIGQYMRDFKAALDSVEAPDFNDWIAANMATVMGTAATTRPLLVKNIVERANILGLPVPTMPDAPAPAPTIVAGTDHPGVTAIQDAKDRRQADNILTEIKRCKDKNQLDLYSRNATVEMPLARWRRDEKFALVDEVMDAFTARRAELTGPPKPPAAA